MNLDTFNFEFLSKSKEIDGKIKQSPDDFIVEEILSDGTVLELTKLPSISEVYACSEGNFALFLLKKRNWTTDLALRRIAKNLRVGKKRFSYAGNKDKKALTTQLCSVFGVKLENLKNIRIKDIEVFPVCYSDRKIKLGELLGNKFSVIIRELKRPSQIFEIDEELNGIFPNYFGLQRFGSNRVTHKIGYLIVKGELEKAVLLFLTAGNQEWRRRLDENRDFKEALNYVPKSFKHERTILYHLSKHPNDFANALRRLPRYTLLLFVHALQSYIFNLELSLRIKENNLKPQENERYVGKGLFNFPDVSKEGNDFVLANIVGYESELNSYEEQILDSLGLNKKEFNIRWMPELSSKGSYRVLLSPYSNFKFRGNTMSFYLPAGSYATSLLREFFKKWV